MNKAKEVHLLKREYIKKNLKKQTSSHSMNQKINKEGERYLEPDKQSFIIGIVGMNEMVKAHTGKNSTNQRIHGSLHSK